MKISSEHVNNLLAYARERHGAACRVEIYEASYWADDGMCEHIDAAIYFRDFLSPMGGRGYYEVERIVL